MRITPDVLASAWGIPIDRAERWADPLSLAASFYSIDTPERLAAFLAQIGHESGSGRYVSEVWGPTPAQARYEGRADLGNTQPGDGAKFKGHGLIQITGRFNHARIRDRLRARFKDVPDFEAEPDALMQPQWAALSAADYWDDKSLNALADAGDFERITRKINGGLNGQADRLKRWERAKAALAVVPTPNAAPAAKENPMPLAPFLAAALPSLIEAIPKLGKLFGSGSDVAERNVAAAAMAVEMVQDAVGAKNAQEAVEIIKADPTAVATAAKAIEDGWFQLAEVGGGVDAARNADAQARATEGPWWNAILRSPSFWALLLLLPLVYLLVLSIIGVIGSAQWSDDVRASIAGLIVGTVVGGSAGYYWGQTTSRNRMPSAE